MPGTPIELQDVEMKPVKETVRHTRHFFPVGQLRGFREDVAKLFNASSASSADRCVDAWANGWNGVVGVL
jgi:hypothetical protein